MTVQYTQAEIRLMLEEPFATRLRIPGIVQEEIGKRMKATAPRRLKQSGGPCVEQQRRAGAKGRATVRAMAQARRVIILPKIKEYLAQGMSSREIARSLGMPDRTVRNLIKEARA